MKKAAPKAKSKKKAAPAVEKKAAPAAKKKAAPAKKPPRALADLYEGMHWARRIMRAGTPRSAVSGRPTAPAR